MLELSCENATVGTNGLTRIFLYTHNSVYIYIYLYTQSNTYTRQPDNFTHIFSLILYIYARNIDSNNHLLNQYDQPIYD